MVEFHSKDNYLAYITERFKSYREKGECPLVKLGINRDNGEYAVALQFDGSLPILIRIKEENGLIKEMWMQPAE